MNDHVYVDLAPADVLALEHLARATGRPRAVIAGRLVHAALAADLPVDPPGRATDPQEVT